MWLANFIGWLFPTLTDFNSAFLITSAQVKIRLAASALSGAIFLRSQVCLLCVLISMGYMGSARGRVRFPF